ncbi:MAG: ArsR family transcriptional regulator [Candidatus Solibacter sp.]|jgi:DNA-binding transcriptional ArsR family regulator
MSVYYRVAWVAKPGKLARMTTSDIVAETGLSRRAVSTHLKALKKNGYLTFKNVARTDIKGGHYVDYGVNWFAIPKSTKPATAGASKPQKTRVRPRPTDEERKEIQANACMMVRRQLGAIISDHSGKPISRNDLDGIVSKLGPLDRITLDTLARVQFRLKKIKRAKGAAYYAVIIPRLLGDQPYIEPSGASSLSSLEFVYRPGAESALL